MSIHSLQSGVDRSYLDETIKPTDDFFKYVNGKWLAQNPIPPDKSSWGSFSKLREDSLHALHEILENLKKENIEQGSERQKLRDYYATGMDMQKRNQQGIVPIKSYLEQIDAIKTLDGMFEVFKTLYAIGVQPFWSFGIHPDEKQSQRVIPYFGQCRLGLPERDYYFRTGEEDKKLREQYQNHIKNIFELAKIDNATSVAESVMTLETKLAEVSMNPVELRDIEAQYNPYSEDGLKELASGIDWSAHLRAMHLPTIEQCIVAQPKFLKSLSSIFSETPLETLKHYITWTFLSAVASSLSDDFVNEEFNFYGKILSGVEELPALWKRCVGATDDALGQALGKLYVAHHFPPEAKRQVNELVDNLIAAYEKRIQALEWMSNATKEKALAKLKAVERKLGYPDVWQDYSDLEIGTNSFVENELAANAYEISRMIAKYGKPVDREEWLMTPPTVNAYYWPNLNQIVFPAGIMQPPFFDPDIYAAKNYGGIGSVIGHELTHGFDDQGSLYDNNGNLHEWWNDEDKKKFKEKTDAIVKQYDQYIVLENLHINGSLTQGENIADLGGVIIAFDALQEHFKTHGRPEEIDGFTPEQLFFIGFAEGECGIRRIETVRTLLKTDPHSPSEFRVNGTLYNVSLFHKVFSSKAGDKLHNEEPLVIW